MYIEKFTFNAFGENTYVVYDDSKQCVIIDPGCYETHEQMELTAFIEEKNLEVISIFNTHAHVDHVLGNYFVKNKYNVNLGLHKLDVPTLKSVELYPPAYGFQMYKSTEPDYFFNEERIIVFGYTELEVLFVPGHAPGHVAFYNRKHKICISGDVLFKGSIGRTDLPGGDYETLIESVKTKIFTLPDETIIYPGHGDITTVGFEKENNPFF